MGDPKGFLDIGRKESGYRPVQERTKDYRAVEHQFDIADLTKQAARCMSCGCCMEVCPQFNERSAFIGPAPIGQAWRFSDHPTGKYYKAERMRALMGEGGITDCGNAQNCIEACPKEIKLTDAIAKLGRDTTIQALKDLFLK